MMSSAVFISASCSGVAVRAASAAAAGSMALRNENKCWIIAAESPLALTQENTTGSRKFHSCAGGTQVPMPELVRSSPLEVSCLTASRITVRLTLKRAPSSASVGNRSPIGSWPEMISSPRTLATTVCRLARFSIARAVGSL